MLYDKIRALFFLPFFIQTETRIFFYHFWPRSRPLQVPIDRYSSIGDRFSDVSGSERRATEAAAAAASIGFPGISRDARETDLNKISNRARRRPDHWWSHGRSNGCVRALRMGFLESTSARKHRREHRINVGVCPTRESASVRNDHKKKKKKFKKYNRRHNRHPPRVIIIR